MKDSVSTRETDARRGAYRDSTYSPTEKASVSGTVMSFDAWPSTEKRQVRSTPVPDDWDNDPDDQVDSKKVWEDANNQKPMPEIMLSSSAKVVIPPVVAAFEAPLRILKRPAPTNTSIASSRLPSQKSMAAREAEYQAARDRIFAPSSVSSTSPDDSSSSGMVASSKTTKNSLSRSSSTNSDQDHQEHEPSPAPSLSPGTPSR